MPPSLDLEELDLLQLLDKDNKITPSFFTCAPEAFSSDTVKSFAARIAKVRVVLLVRNHPVTNGDVCRGLGWCEPDLCTFVLRNSVWDYANAKGASVFS